MKLKELIKNLKYKHLENISDYDIKGISSNSNCIQPGYLFVAIKGRRFDGHNFLNQAIDRGAKAVIVEKNLPLKKKVAKILVFSILSSYEKLFGPALGPLICCFYPFS